MEKQLTIGLTYDLRVDYLAQGYSENEVAEFDSEETINAFVEVIGSLGHKAEKIGNAKELCKQLVSGKRWDLVFNIAEGLKGRSREAQVPAILELYNIPYTFSDPLVCAVCLDKSISKKIVQAENINTPKFKLISTESDLEDFNLNFPVFSKPVSEGTGKGVDASSKANNIEELNLVCLHLLKEFKQPVLVEEYLPGREFTVGILGTEKKARVIGTMEIIILPHSPIKTYSYLVKEKCEELVKYVPSDSNDPLISEVEKVALNSYRALQCRDGGRVDVKIDSIGKPSFIEVNPLAGLHPHHSDLPIIASQKNIPYKKLISEIIDSALSRVEK